MVNRTNANSLYDRALSLAQDVFALDDSGDNTDKVCAVALHVASDSSVVLFSGRPGYSALLKRVGGNEEDAKHAVTHWLTDFLRSEKGGNFTLLQINHSGLDRHGRGAMNCAEPKVYYYISAIKQSNSRDWVIIPFNKVGEGLTYNPPCMNCRQWVYKQFHGLSETIARARGGPNALVMS